jgi:hypothetical protein
VNRISGIIGLDSDQINAEINRLIRRAQNAANYERGDQQAPKSDYGRGAFAVAQREVLEVLLNEPALYETARQKITADVFDEPILRQIGEILFETLELDSEAQLRQVLAGIESVQLSNCLMELAQAGHLKGNYKWRLNKALDAIEKHQAQKRKNMIESTQDKSEYLRKLYDHTGKVNVHTMGIDGEQIAAGNRRPGNA